MRRYLLFAPKSRESRFSGKFRPRVRNSRNLSTELKERPRDRSFRLPPLLFLSLVFLRLKRDFPPNLLVHFPPASKLRLPRIFGRGRSGMRSATCSLARRSPQLGRCDGRGRDYDPSVRPRPVRDVFQFGSGPSQNGERERGGPRLTGTTSCTHLPSSSKKNHTPRPDPRAL